jgi:hypothetical protein
MGVLQFRVKWEAYPLEDTWEPYKYLKYNTELLKFLSTPEYKEFINTFVYAKYTKMFPRLVPFS